MMNEWAVIGLINCVWVRRLLWATECTSANPQRWNSSNGFYAETALAASKSILQPFSSPDSRHFRNVMQFVYACTREPTNAIRASHVNSNYLLTSMNRSTLLAMVLLYWKQWLTLWVTHTPRAILFVRIWNVSREQNGNTANLAICKSANVCASLDWPIDCTTVCRFGSIFVRFVSPYDVIRPTQIWYLTNGWICIQYALKRTRKICVNSSKHAETSERWWPAWRLTLLNNYFCSIIFSRECTWRNCAFCNITRPLHGKCRAHSSKIIEHTKCISGYPGAKTMHFWQLALPFKRWACFSSVKREHNSVESANLLLFWQTRMFMVSCFERNHVSKQWQLHGLESDCTMFSLSNGTNVLNVFLNFCRTFQRKRPQNRRNIAPRTS